MNSWQDRRKIPAHTCLQADIANEGYGLRCPYSKTSTPTAIHKQYMPGFPTCTNYTTGCTSEPALLSVT